MNYIDSILNSWHKKGYKTKEDILKDKENYRTKREKIDVFETSAKNGHNINQIFDKLIDIIINSRSEDELIREFGVKSKSRGTTLSKKKSGKAQKQGCCK